MTTAAAEAPPIPKMPIFFDWELALICNYRCSYCPLNVIGFENHRWNNVFPGLPRLAEVWSRIHERYGSCHIQLAGGESSTYPRFYEFIEMLTSFHTVTFVTNLSFDVDKFASRVNLSRVKITASFHPQFADFGEFLRKCALLQEKGMREDIAVTFVAYPDQLRRMKEYKRAFNEAGLQFRPDPFNGVYKNNAVYPAAYTEEERRIIVEALSDGREDSRLSLARFNWRGHAINSTTAALVKKVNEGKAKAGEKLLEESMAWAGAKPIAEGREQKQESRKPVLCHMGQKYAKIRSNGDVFRYCAQPRDDRPSPVFEDRRYLGNLFLDDDFKLLDGPAWCDFEPCPCDRCMLAGEHDRWGELWAAPAPKAVPPVSLADGGSTMDEGADA